MLALWLRYACAMLALWLRYACPHVPNPSPTWVLSATGDVELHDLELKPAVIREALALPIDIRFGKPLLSSCGFWATVSVSRLWLLLVSGRVGKLALHVSWTSLLSSPIIAELSDGWSGVVLLSFHGQRLMFISPRVVVYILVTFSDSIDVSWHLQYICH